MSLWCTLLFYFFIFSIGRGVVEFLMRHTHSINLDFFGEFLIRYACSINLVKGECCKISIKK
jgi:hypothetical protein